jgi:hypothetical protein
MLSDAYKRVLRATRAQYPTWGGARRHAAPVLRWLEGINLHTGSILDYGAGLGRFADELELLAPGRYTVTNYEPAIPAFDKLPLGPYDAVVATHVLEHVEPELLDATLEELRTRARRLVYIEVPHGLAGKTLADGRNAHLIVEPPEWWARKIDVAFAGHSVYFWRADNPLNTIYTVCL